MEVYGENSTPDSIEALRIARHERFCTALPFPLFDWTSEESIGKSLIELRDYSEQLANSALDWYLEKKTWKKLVARCLQYLTYFFGIFAAFIPLLKISTVLDFIRQHYGIDTNLSSVAAEAALLLIGIAGGFNLIDRTAGFTADWMRYIATAARINRALIEFQFKWERLDCELPYPAKRKDEESLSTTSRKTKDAPSNPAAQRIELCRSFCMEVFDLMGQETSIWANELKERVAQMASQFPHHRP